MLTFVSVDQEVVTVYITSSVLHGDVDVCCDNEWCVTGAAPPPSCARLSADTETTLDTCSFCLPLILPSSMLIQQHLEGRRGEMPELVATAVSPISLSLSLSA